MKTSDNFVPGSSYHVLDKDDGYNFNIIMRGTAMAQACKVEKKTRVLFCWRY